MKMEFLYGTSTNIPLVGFSNYNGRKMFLMAIILFILSLSVVAIDAPNTYIDIGMSVHSNRIDGPEFLSDNPLGTIEIGIQKKRIKVYYEHTSSILYREDGYGMNQIGIKYRIWGK